MNIEGFQQEKLLGKGAYGQVYKALRLSDNKSYAVKIVDLSKLSKREIDDAVNEIRIMASFTSPFIISFYEAFVDKKKLYIVTEYAQLGDLCSLILRRKRKNRPLKEEQIWQYLLELLEGLRVLHSCGVVHRDLKSANILLSAPDLVKIGDLGISTVLRTRQLAKTQIGTPLYLAPEIWKNKPYDQKCDMWSLGILLYEMMTFDFPFLGRTTEDLSRKICTGHYSIPTKYSPDLTSILKQLLMVNPSDRPTVNELLNLQCVKSRMDLLNPFIQSEILANPQCPRLLSTIKVAGKNVSNVNLPNPKYNRRPSVIKPLAERVHMKNGTYLRRLDLSTISTPDLRLITDQDLWSPNKDIRPSYNSDPLPQFKRYKYVSNRPILDQQDELFALQQQLGNIDNLIRNPYDLQACNPQQQRHDQDINYYPKPQQVEIVFSPEQKGQKYQKDANFKPYNKENNNDIKQNYQCYERSYQNQNNFEQPIAPQKPKMYDFGVNDVESPRKFKQVSPRIIPSRYKHNHQLNPNISKRYQDPRWKRRDSSPVEQNKMFDPQQNLPWHQPQRRNPMVAINPRFRNIGKL